MPFDGSYPAPPGNKRDSVLDIPISGAYTSITTGTPPTGGISVSAAQFGLQYIETAQCMGSDNGQYDGVVFMAPFNKNQPSNSILVQLITASTGVPLASGTVGAGRTMRVTATGW